MFPNCIDHFGRQKRETKQQQTNTDKQQPKNERELTASRKKTQFSSY